SVSHGLLGGERHAAAHATRIDFTQVREGETDPALGKIVSVLILADSDYIVYLDGELYVEWACSETYQGNHCGSPSVLNRLARLEVPARSYFSPLELSQY